MREQRKGQEFLGTSARITISALFMNMKLQTIGYLRPGSRSLRHALIAYPTMRDRRSDWNSAQSSKEDEHMSGLNLGMQKGITKAEYRQLVSQDNTDAVGPTTSSLRLLLLSLSQRAWQVLKGAIAVIFSPGMAFSVT